MNLTIVFNANFSYLDIELVSKVNQTFLLVEVRIVSSLALVTISVNYSKLRMNGTDCRLMNGTVCRLIILVISVTLYIEICSTLRCLNTCGKTKIDIRQCQTYHTGVLVVMK